MTNEQIDALVEIPAGLAPPSDKDPQMIYLEQECCADRQDGRRWGDDGCFSHCDCEDGVAPTKYIRADLVRELAEQVKQLRDELELALRIS